MKDVLLFSLIMIVPGSLRLGCSAFFASHQRLSRPPFGRFLGSFASAQSASPVEPNLTHGARPPLLLVEGIFAVYKPLNWTSSNVVSYIRGILERDARRRGARPRKVGTRRQQSRVIRVGHGGTLDPLATGVLVIGVGKKGTKQLQRYDGSNSSIGSMLSLNGD